MYQNVFSLDEVPYNKRLKKEESSPLYQLHNYEYHQPKLESDIYLRVFIKKLLFEVDILDIDNFLDYQYEHSEEPIKLINIIELKVLPAIDNIVSNASLSLNSGYPSKNKLEDNFVEIDGVYKNDQYEFSLFYHKTAFLKLSQELKARKAQISNWLKSLNNLEVNPMNYLKWSGKPSHLAYIIRNLVDQGYIIAPVGNNQEINLSELARQIQKSFLMDKGELNTLRIYLSTESEKYQKLNESFEKQEFKIPNSGLVS
ncbi:hypothetical protein [Zobellia sp. B3R18]|uniref:hypothetical protein n=1 Tax=Zobellia sp. B3R18 TaxID=2841568 RepID=UPI001C06B2E4|nr:hypothetical protein [Zobellia sp. B3R18]MBU2974991.1 hypothetical protein [Zobellia sp. B3R18]